MSHSITTLVRRCTRKFNQLIARPRRRAAASLGLVAAGWLAGSLLPTPVNAEYSYFYTSSGGSISGSDIVMKELRWPYWNSHYYNTWINDNWTSSDGVSDYFYNGLALPAAGSPNPVGTQQTFNFSFWPLSNPINITDTIHPVYSSPSTFSMQTIAEGSLFRSPGLWSLWQTNVWYRMALRTWQPVNGAAHVGYAGTWLRDPVAGVWYHMATVQLPFSVTGVTGSDGFQENASGSNLPERTDYRNCYYHLNGAWSPANNFQIYDHAGGTENVGLIESNTAVYYETCENNTNYTGTITNAGQYSSVLVMTNQPATPPLDAIIVTNYGATMTNTQLLVQWQVPATSSPQFAYQVNVYTNAGHTGTVVATAYDIAPDARQKLLTIPAGITPYAQLTIIDLFNQTNAPVSLTTTNASLLAASSGAGLVNGLAYAYYESASNIYGSSSGTNWSAMPSFASLTPVYNGAANNLDLTSRRRRDGYAYNYTGYLNVATAGLYTFTLNSDAGSKLYVDGQLVVNWDGEHSPSDLSGWVGLQAGYHTVNVQYFCDTQPTSLFSEYFDTLTLSYEGPGIAKTTVPDSAFFRPSGTQPTVVISSPGAGATVAGASVPLGATITPNGNTINNVQFYVGNNYWAQDAGAPYSLSSFFWDSTNAIRARVFYNSTNIVDSAANTVVTTNQNLAPWQFGQIFYHNLPDGAAIQGGTYSMIGDGMNLLTREVSGNCTLIAHLAGLPTTAAGPDGSTPNSGWEAGIILRGNTNMTPGYPWGQTGNAPFTALFGEVGGGAYYQDETMVNGGGGYPSSSLGSQTWFKLQRTNTTFISSVSSDGVTWTPVFTNSLTDFGTTVYAGFFSYAGPSSNPNVPWASFDNVSITGNILGPPGVTVAPQTATLYAGQSTTLTASPSGNAPFTYQWQLNGSNIAGATNTTLNLTGLLPAASGLYSVVLNNSNGTATATATLTVLTPPPVTSQIISNNPIAYWRLNETAGPTAYDTMGQFNGTGEGGLVFGVPGVTTSPFTGFETNNLAAQFNGTNSDISLPALNLNTNAVTITGWIKSSGTQTAWSGLLFCRAGTTGAGFHFGTANELRYTWNNTGGSYNWNSGLVPPTNVWTFVALVIQPGQTIIYMATNATLQSATNVLANAVQAFAGTSYLGYDPNSGTRRFNGVLDEVAVYNQSLTATQLGQILTASQLGTAPVVSLTSPATGTGLAAPATISLTAGVVTNGHSITSVQFYNGATLLGQSTTAPYGYTWTNVTVGTYSLYAQVTYDSGATASSVPSLITVNWVPLAPASLTPVALASNLVSVTWPAITNASGYLLSRNGVAIASVAGTNWLDIGLAASTLYNYSVAATNAYGSSPASVTNSVTTPASGLALWWDAGGSVSGPQDGNGNWAVSGNPWWNGLGSGAWTNSSLAVFGTGTGTNCAVQLTGNVTPSGIWFNADNGGVYSLSATGTNILILAGTPVITANASASISAPLSGGGLTKTGPGTLTLTGGNTNTGTVTVNGGQLVATGGGWYGNRSIGSGLLVISNGASAEFTVAHGFGYGTGGEPVTINNGTLQFDHENYVSALNLTGGGVIGAGEIRTIATTYYTYGAATNSLIGCTLNLVSSCTFSVTNGTSAVGLLVTGTAYGAGGITKAGPGLLQWTGTATNTGATTVSAGTLQVNGSLGTNSVTVQSGSTLTGTGVINGATTVQSGGTLAPGGTSLLTFGSALSLNSGSSFILNVSKNGSTLTNGSVSVAGTLTFGGTLTVANIGTNALVTGDHFDLYNAGGLSGTFSAVTLPSLAGGLAWDTSQLYVSGVITVVTLPTVTVVPTATNIVYGNSVTLTATIGGTTPLSCQWYDENTNAIAGATNQTFTLTAPAVLASGNYTVIVTNISGSATASSAVTVSPATLTVTANNTNRIYGAANPAFTASYTGFVNGDTTAVLGGSPSLTTTANSGSGVGAYTITAGAGTLSAANYTFGFNNGTLIVNPAALTVTANSTNKLYGQTLIFAGTQFTSTGLLNSDTITNVTLASTGATNAATVGSYPVTAAAAQGTGLGNYAISYVSGTLTVNPATLTVSANNTNRIYGAANPTFTASYTGFVNGDTVAVLGGSPSLTTTATTNSAVGTYTITAGLGALTATNYSFGFTNGTLTVNSAALTVTANNQAKTYGQSLTFAGTEFATAGLLNGDTVTNVTLASTGTTNTAGTGSYAITASSARGSGLGNYTISYVNGTLTVNPATLTVSANNTNRIYGAVNPTFTASFTGFVNGDTMAVLGGSPSLTTTATTNSAVGTYTITAALGTLTATNYSFGFTNGLLTVNSATLTITANNTNKVYGQSLSFAGNEFAASGLLNSDTVTNVTLASTGATNVAAVGSYTITAAAAQGTGLGNYAISYVSGTLTVNPATLTVSANNTNRIYGAVNPAFTASYTGFVNGDTVAVVSGSPSLTTTATTNSVVGTYTITAGLGTLTATNYSFGFTNGTLTVNTAALTITANSTNKLYGQTLVFAGTEFTSSGLLNSDTVTNVVLASTGATNTAGAGTYPITAATAQGTGLGNYAISYVSGTLTVTGSLPTAPQNLIAQAIATNQISLSWSAVTNTTGYVVSRGGSAVANVAGTNYTDTGLAMGTPYTYTVAATNAIGSSPPSAPANATTPVLGATLTWDTGTSTNAQDGSGVWSTNLTTWLYGTNNLGWYDGNVAAFGVDTTTNCTVTLTNDVTPTGITFNATGGGSYTITGTNNIWLANSPAVTMNGSGTISTPVNGTGSLTENGGGTLTLTTHNGYSGGTIVNAGKLVSTISCWYTPRGIGSGLLTVNSGATAEFTATHGFGGDASGRPAVINNGTLQFDHENYVSGLAMTGGGITGAGEIRTIATTYYIYGTTTNSLIGCNINMVNACTFSVTNGSSTVGLLVSGTVYGAGGLTKAGPGLLQLTGTATNTGATTVSAGTLQVDGSLGTNTVTVPSGSTLSGTGTINGATTIQSGGTLAPGDSAIGTLTISNALTLAGNAAFAVNKSGSTLTGDLVQGLGTVTYGGTLTVTATGTALAAGDSFTLFAGAGYTGSFTTITLPTLGSGLAWDTSNLAVNGSIAVAALPLITTQPANQSVTQGSPATFSVTATGTALNYQWQKNGASIGGATASSYTISSTTTNDAASYSVVIANAVGSTNSATATLTVNVPPGITTQPVSQNINQGSPVTFSVTATGTAPLTYQWLKNGTNISGATSSSYAISSVVATDAANYTVAIANVAGSTNSSVATLTVNVPPTITTQPASQTVIVGNPVTFTVAATGTAPLSYQWQKNGANISGATTASYTIGSVGTNDAANYTAIVTNIAGSVTSSTATLTVNAPFGDWHFDDGTGTVATDSAAVPHNGTVSGTNATWVTGIKGNALQFTGVSNYVAFGTGPSLSGTNNFTIAAWIKTSSTNTAVIMQQRDAAGYNGEYRLSINGTGTLEFMVYGDLAYQFDFTTTNVLNNGAWHFVVAERNGLTGNIYLDGNPTPAATATGTAIVNLTNTITVAVGRDIRGNANNFTGVIDEVKLYKVALSGADVSGLYNTYLGLVSPWLTADIGSGITTGSATQTNGVFTVQGAGNLSGTADNFRFVYQNMSGDAEIRARIPSYQNTGASGRLGVMMRDSLTANSMNAFMGIQVTNGTFYFQTRTSSGGATTSTSSGTGTAPNIWVRLVRSGTTLSGYKSSDGATWTLVSTNTFTMSTNCYFGLSVASETTNTLNTATFDNLTVSP